MSWKTELRNYRAGQTTSNTFIKQRENITPPLSGCRYLDPGTGSRCGKPFNGPYCQDHGIETPPPKINGRQWSKKI